MWRGRRTRSSRLISDAPEEVAGARGAQVVQRLGDRDLDVLLGDLVGSGIGVEPAEPFDHRVAAGAGERQLRLLCRQVGKQVGTHRGSHAIEISGRPASLARMENEVVEPAAVDLEIEEELLVEEISIDGMCGVY
jgi:mycofactocin precursor